MSAPDDNLAAAFSDAVPGLLTTRLSQTFAGRAIPVGHVGVPGFVTAAAFDELKIPDTVGPLHAEVLAYLRAVRGGVRIGTVAFRVGRSEEEVEAALNALIEAGAVFRDEGKFEGLYFIAFAWRHILPEVVAVEFPTPIEPPADGPLAQDGWPGAVERALQYRAFAHRVFVALPTPDAETLVRDHGPMLRERQVGVLAVGDTGVSIAQDSVRLHPFAWLPYYRLALTVARRRATR